MASKAKITGRIRHGGQRAPIISTATGNMRAVQIMLGHPNIGNTARYLGVYVEGALTVAEGIDVNDQIPIS